MTFFPCSLVSKDVSLFQENVCERNCNKATTKQRARQFFTAVMMKKYPFPVENQPMLE